MTNKERFENLEIEMAELQAGFQNLENRVGADVNEILTTINNLQARQPERPPSPRREGGALVDPNAIHRQRKMDFPRFTGNDPMVWLDRAEKYFHTQGVPENQRVTTASYYLENEAIH